MDIQSAAKEIIRALGDDPSRQGLEGTPQLMAELYQDLGRGYRVSEEELLADGVLPNPGGQDVIRAEDIPFFSLCEHHLLPFFGTCSISYCPSDKILGFGKLPDIVELYSRRLQLQERLTTEIANCIEKYLKPKSLVVRISAQQLCVTMRGKGGPETRFHTEVRRGS